MWCTIGKWCGTWMAVAFWGGCHRYEALGIGAAVVGRSRCRLALPHAHGTQRLPLRATLLSRAYGDGTQ